MDLYLTKEKLPYDGSYDIYIGKIGRKRLYCLNDVCRIFGIFFRSTKSKLAENGKFMIGVMIQRKVRYIENTFVDYDALIEVLLMARYDKSAIFKKWLDSIPVTAFKKCQKYVKKSDVNKSCLKVGKARSNANKNRETNLIDQEQVEVENIELSQVEPNPVESKSVEPILVELDKSRQFEPSKAHSKGNLITSTKNNNEDATNENKAIPSDDMILSICSKENYSVEMFIFLLDHLNFSARIAYLNNKSIDFGNAVKHLEWIEDLILALKKKYGNTPYYKYSPKLVQNKEKLSKMK